MLDWQGRVAECTGANIFSVRNGVPSYADRRLLPRRNHPIDGIDLARRRGFEVIERRILPAELGGFDECFITGTAAEVTPVGEIGPHAYKPGAVTAALVDAYTDGSQSRRTQGCLRRELAAPKVRRWITRGARRLGALGPLAQLSLSATELSITNFRPTLSKSTVSWAVGSDDGAGAEFAVDHPRSRGGSRKTANHVHGPRLQKTRPEVWRFVSPIHPHRATAPRRDASRACRNARQTQHSDRRKATSDSRGRPNRQIPRTRHALRAIPG